MFYSLTHPNNRIYPHCICNHWSEYIFIHLINPVWDTINSYLIISQEDFLLFYICLLRLQKLLFLFLHNYFSRLLMGTESERESKESKLSAHFDNNWLFNSEQILFLLSFNPYLFIFKINFRNIWQYLKFHVCLKSDELVGLNKNWRAHLYILSAIYIYLFFIVEKKSNLTKMFSNKIHKDDKKTFVWKGHRQIVHRNPYGPHILDACHRLYEILRDKKKKQYQKEVFKWLPKYFQIVRCFILNLFWKFMIHASVCFMNIDVFILEDVFMMPSDVI